MQAHLIAGNYLTWTNCKSTSECMGELRANPFSSLVSSLINLGTLLHANKIITCTYFSWRNFVGSARQPTQVSWPPWFPSQSIHAVGVCMYIVHACLPFAPPLPCLTSTQIILPLRDTALRAPPFWPLGGPPPRPRVRRILYPVPSKTMVPTVHISFQCSRRFSSRLETTAPIGDVIIDSIPAQDHAHNSDTLLYDASESYPGMFPSWLPWYQWFSVRILGQETIGLSITAEYCQPFPFL